jgi:phage gpG-like protein
MRGLTINLQEHVIRDKLSGQVLNQKSGALARSIQQMVTATDETVTGEVFSAGDVKYARIHEYGGTTPAHDIIPTKANALAFAIGGKQIFAKIVHHPGSKMPERSFLRSSLADQATEIMDGLRSATLKAMRRLVGQ